MPGIGVLAGGAVNANWLEYGARLGYRFTKQASVDVFANGISGDKAIGNSVHVGLDLRYRF